MMSEVEARRRDQFMRAQREIKAEVARTEANIASVPVIEYQAENKVDPQSIDAAQDEQADRGKRIAAMDELVQGIMLLEAPYARVVTDVTGSRGQECFAWWISSGAIEETARNLLSEDHEWNMQMLRERIGYSCTSLVKRYGARELGKIESEAGK